jgi:hypothetical protein
MAEVFRHKGPRIVVYSNDHPPAHVHLLRGAESPDEAKFALDVDAVTLVWSVGFKASEVRSAGQAITDRLALCWAKWREIHG